jgi:hypothetical protein
MKKTWAEEFAAILGTDYQRTHVLAPRLRQADTGKVMRLMPTNMPPKKQVPTTTRTGHGKTLKRSEQIGKGEKL